MQEEIEIRNCECCRPLDKDETKYQTDIIATSCTWWENIEGHYSLQQPPDAGHTYYVTLKQPVRFHLNMELWLLYDCPLVSLNGYEKEEEIEQAKFCYGRISEIVTYNELGATIAFRILKALTLQDILKTKATVELPGFWADFFNVYVDRDDYYFATIGKYYLLSVSVQGDTGQTCVFTEHENELIICLLHEWSFAENGTFGGKYILPGSIKKQVMTKK